MADGKKPTFGRKLVHRCQGSIAVASFTFASILPRRAPPGQVPITVHESFREWHGSGDRWHEEGRQLSEVAVISRNQYHNLDINKTCVSAHLTSNSIYLEFKDGSTLKVKMKDNSIRKIYLTSEYSNSTIELDPEVLNLVDLMANCRVDNMKSHSYAKTFSSGEEIVFTMDGGSQLVIELEPGAIQKIDYKTI